MAKFRVKVRVRARVRVKVTVRVKVRVRIKYRVVSGAANRTIVPHHRHHLYRFLGCLHVSQLLSM